VPQVLLVALRLAQALAHTQCVVAALAHAGWPQLAALLLVL
jgi:hypothetical protein